MPHQAVTNGKTLAKRRHEIGIASIASILICVLCHWHALKGGWRYDDGPYLYFAALFTPGQYFLDPDIIRQQSWAHLTPWSALFYDIGLATTGLNPIGHYAQMLVILCLAGIATFLLWRLWLPFWSALGASVLFLAMPATGSIAQLLMTGHYAYGLLFTILTLYFFVRAIRDDRSFYGLVAAFFYFLACLTKELYLPVIAILPFVPEGKLSQRIRHGAPAGLVALFYIPLRLYILEGIGGYGMPISSGPELTTIARQTTSLLFGDGLTGIAVLAFTTMSLLIAFIRQNPKPNSTLLITGLLLLLIPILPAVPRGFEDPTSGRLLFFVAWALSGLIAWLTHASPWQTRSVWLIAILLMSTQQTLARQIQKNTSITELEQAFLIDGPSESVLLPYRIDNSGYLDSLRQAAVMYGRPIPPEFIRDELDLLGPWLQKRQLYRYEPSCHCIEKIPKQTQRNLVDDIRQRYLKGANQALSVELVVESNGLRKTLRWKFTGPGEHFCITIREWASTCLPQEGQHIYGIDFTGPRNTKQLNLRITNTSTSGWSATTPLLQLLPDKPNRVTWQGRSAFVNDTTSSEQSTALARLPPPLDSTQAFWHQ